MARYVSHSFKRVVDNNGNTGTLVGFNRVDPEAAIVIFDNIISRDKLSIPTVLGKPFDSLPHVPAHLMENGIWYIKPENLKVIKSCGSIVELVDLK